MGYRGWDFTNNSMGDLHHKESVYEELKLYPSSTSNVTSIQSDMVFNRLLVQNLVWCKSKGGLSSNEAVLQCNPSGNSWIPPSPQREPRWPPQQNSLIFFVVRRNSRTKKTWRARNILCNKQRVNKEIIYTGLHRWQLKTHQTIWNTSQSTSLPRESLIIVGS